jgi:hypothetical protein
MRCRTGPVMLIVPTTLLAMAGPVIVRRHVEVDHLRTNNEVAGSKFATVGVLYAVLLAFAVVVVWEVAKEAGATATVFRLTQGVDPERGAAIREATTDYLTSAIASDWPAMESGTQSPATTGRDRRYLHDPGAEPDTGLLPQVVQGARLSGTCGLKWSLLSPSIRRGWRLMSYGPTKLKLSPRGDYVDKILKSAKPQDFPIKRPTKFRTAGADLCERWPSRLVATATENRLSITRKLTRRCGTERLPNNSPLQTHWRASLWQAERATVGQQLTSSIYASEDAGPA